jgi:hypothetical protein
MKLNKNLAMVLLAVWLLTVGVFQVVSFGGAIVGLLLSILAIAAGIVIIITMRSELEMLLTGVWLTTTGAVSLANLGISGLGLILGLLAIASGALIVLRIGKPTSNLGKLLLAIWLIGTGLISVISLDFVGLGTIMGLLAVAAGVLLLLKR